MSGAASVFGAAGESGRAMLAITPREIASATGRIVTAEQLMAPECGVVLPRLSKIPLEYRFLAHDREMIALAEILLESDIGAVEDWDKSNRDATNYVKISIQRWIRDHGGVAIERRFDLEVTLSDRLVDYSDERGPEGTLYLIVDPAGAAFVLLKPTLDLLEKVHPRLPATFLNHFTGSLNRWVRVYDYHDAEERVEMLREWYEDEENAEQFEVPDIEGCTPKYLRERPLSLRSLRELSQRTRRKQAKDLIENLLALRQISRRAKRPEFTDEMGEQLMDNNPALPCLLAAFLPGDAIVGCFDDEAQTALETTPQPNLVIPLRFAEPSSVRLCFQMLGVFCETLAAASRLIDLMPGNDDGVMQREGS